MGSVRVVCRRIVWPHEIMSVDCLFILCGGWVVTAYVLPRFLSFIRQRWVLGDQGRSMKRFFLPQTIYGNGQ
jgi:hypothetical protein